MSLFQQTIGSPIQIEGIGLHSGKKVKMEIFPAPPSTGIQFISTQNFKKMKFRASVHHITKTMLSTTLGLGIKDNEQVHTVEHLLSALHGMEIDNVSIHLNDVEIPIMDGSALPFVKLIVKAGTVKQNKERSFLRILKKIQIEENGKSLSILPYSGVKISYSINFNNPLITQQDYTLNFSKHHFMNEIAPARTFGFLNEVEALQKRGLIQGGSLDNAVVVDQGGVVLNKEGLRFPNEFVRHKILDLIGDFSLLGHPIQGHIIAHCAGHTLHARLMEKILQEKEAWELVEEQPFISPVPSVLSASLSLSSHC